MKPELPQPKPGILNIAPYVAGKSSASGGRKIVKLSSNENALGAPPQALEAYRATASTLNRYPDSGASALRAAIARRHGLEESRIVCGAGSDELIGLLVHAYAGAGDEVLQSAHGFLMYSIYALGAGATPVMAPEKNLTADPEALLARVNERTRILFLANPNNPTGSHLSGDAVRALRSRLRSDILLVLDEAYGEYVNADDYEEGFALVRETQNTVVLRTFSKIYGLSALRLGWGYMPEAVADVLNRLRGPFNVSAPAIAAGTAAIESHEWVRTSVAHNTRERERLGAELEAMGLKIYPSQGNFLLVEFPRKGEQSAESANKRLLSQGIIVRDVKAYGLPDCLRVTIGLEAENDALIEGLKELFPS